MSGTSVVTMADAGSGGGGGYYYRPPPFTAVQWQELEQQAMIYKYLLAGMPIPSELIFAVRRSFDAISSRFFDSSLSYSSYYGKKFDLEPGRCKRTDGKKWRCAKDAHPDSKYCERHMHRGKGRNNTTNTNTTNRSRKPVESSSSSYSALHQQKTSSPSLSMSAAGVNSNAVTVATAGGYSNSTNNGIFQNSSVYQNIPFFSIGSSDDVYSGNNVAKFRIDYGSSENEKRGYRFGNGVRDPGDLGLEPSGSIGNRVCSNAGQGSELHHVVNNAYDHHHMEESTMSKLKQQNFYGDEIEHVKHEHHSSMQPFFDEWPTTKESWSNDLGENSAWKSNAMTHSKTTMLSMSTIPLMDFSEFSASNAHSPEDV